MACNLHADAVFVQFRFPIINLCAARFFLNSNERSSKRSIVKKLTPVSILRDPILKREFQDGDRSAQDEFQFHRFSAGTGLNLPGDFDEIAASLANHGDFFNDHHAWFRKKREKKNNTGDIRSHANTAAI